MATSKDLVHHKASCASGQGSHIDAGKNPLYRDPGHLPVGEDTSQECQV